MSGSEKVPLIFFSLSEDGHFLTISTRRYFAVYSGRTLKLVTKEARFGGVRTLSTMGKSPLYFFASSGDLAGKKQKIL
jgi:hypothetical protein